MQTAPHSYPLVQPDEVEEISRQFEAEYGASWIERKLQLDTSALTPEVLLTTFLQRVVPLLSTRDLLRRQALG